MIQVIQGAGNDVKALRAYLMSLSHETLLRLFVTLCTMGVMARWIYLRAIRNFVSIAETMMLSSSTMTN